jgi:hypothetical protein
MGICIPQPPGPPNDSRFLPSPSPLFTLLELSFDLFLVRLSKRPDHFPVNGLGEARRHGITDLLAGAFSRELVVHGESLQHSHLPVGVGPGA